jgi:hypothetical protein
VPVAIKASVRERMRQNTHVSTYGLANMYGLNDLHKDCKFIYSLFVLLNNILAAPKHKKNLIAQTVQQEIT